jgi:hypothetical protein
MSEMSEDIEELVEGEEEEEEEEESCNAAYLYPGIPMESMGRSSANQ